MVNNIAVIIDCSWAEQKKALFFNDITAQNIAIALPAFVDFPLTIMHLSRP
jgi:ribosome biogenesis protein Tsr3